MTRSTRELAVGSVDTGRGLFITYFSEDVGKRVRIGEYEFQKATTAVPLDGDFVLGYLGSGIAYYKDGKYVGYSLMPHWVNRLPLEEIVETDEFKKVLQEIQKELPKD